MHLANNARASRVGRRDGLGPSRTFGSSPFVLRVVPRTILMLGPFYDAMMSSCSAALALVR